MRVTIQTENMKNLRESVHSNCSGVRFGSEFCEWKIPSLGNLKEAYTIVKEAGKKFSYLTPRISETNLGEVKEQLDFLNGEGDAGLVFNDLGVLSLLEHNPNLTPQLGRQLVFIPARCPWEQITNFEVSFMARRHVAKLFYQTNLNNAKTINFFLEHGVRNVDLDWIPPCFPYFKPLRDAGLNLSVHLHLTPVTSTRRCHTARFLGIDNPVSCPRPCFERGFLLRNMMLYLDFYLLGNVVFRYSEPSPKEIRNVHSLLGEFEFVVSMNPITGLEDRKTIDMLIDNLSAFR